MSRRTRATRASGESPRSLRSSRASRSRLSRRSAGSRVTARSGSSCSPASTGSGRRRVRWSMAALWVICRSHARNEASARKRGRRWNARRNASWLTSSASSRPTMRAATRTTTSRWRSTSASNARRSPRSVASTYALSASTGARDATSPGTRLPCPGRWTVQTRSSPRPRTGRPAQRFRSSANAGPQSMKHLAAVHGPSRRCRGFTSGFRAVPGPWRRAVCDAMASTSVPPSRSACSPRDPGAAPAADRVQEDPPLFGPSRDRRDPVDRGLLVEGFLPLARQLARRYERPEEPFDDLFQVACLGLVKAIDRFDLSRDVAFSSYAVPTILGEIKRYFRDRTWSVRVPRDLQELALRVDRKVSELSTDLRRQPTVSEIAEAVGIEEEDVLEALEASGAYRATSLSTPRGNEDEAGETLGDTVGTSEEGFGLAESRATLEQLMRAVTPREREVLRLRFEEDLTQAEIGERIGVSQMQVSRIIRQSLARLRAIAEPNA